MVHTVDDAALRTEILSRFPEGALLDVLFWRHDALSASVLEPGEVSVSLVPRGPKEFNADPQGAPQEVCEQVVREFGHSYFPVLQRLRKDLAGLLSERLRTVGVNYGKSGVAVSTMDTPPAERGLVPVMTRLAPSDLDTLDLLIAAGLATSRADAVRWCLGRIRERPAYQELQSSVRRIQQLKTTF